jgi:hypothetical protein
MGTAKTATAFGATLSSEQVAAKVRNPPFRDVWTAAFERQLRDITRRSSLVDSMTLLGNTEQFRTVDSALRKINGLGRFTGVPSPLFSVSLGATPAKSASAMKYATTMPACRAHPNLAEHPGQIRGDGSCATATNPPIHTGGAQSVEDPGLDRGGIGDRRGTGNPQANSAHCRSRHLVGRSRRSELGLDLRQRDM